VLAREQRELIADLSIAIGAVALLASLFLTWSHQFSRSFSTEWGASGQLRAAPHDPTAWQVYSIADVILALLALALLAAALRGGRRARLVLFAGALIALAFTLHALSAPPTDGANLVPPFGAPGYVPNAPASGAGETVAVVALGVAIAGLTLSFTAD
jgi:hypothetical protein